MRHTRQGRLPIRTALLFAASVTLSAFAAPPVTLIVRLPERVSDSTTINAEVTLENRSMRVLAVSALNAGTLRFYVSPIERAHSGECRINTISTPVGVSTERIRLLPGQRLQAVANVLRDYPLGLSPGRYRVHASYFVGSSAGDVGPLQSEPVSVTIEPLATPAYRSFLEICSALGEHRADAISRLLAFANGNSSFEFTAPLVESVLYELRGETGIQAADFLMRSYPGTSHAEVGERAKDFFIHVDCELRDYDAYMSSLRDAASRPENAEVVRDAQRLGSITKPADFGPYEEFLRRHSTSYFSAEARWLMINAVENGIVPPGTMKEAALARLYTELVERDGESYWARKALRDPAVAALVGKNKDR